MGRKKNTRVHAGEKGWQGERGVPRIEDETRRVVLTSGDTRATFVTKISRTPKQMEEEITGAR
ncbi:hypothetical protein K0M31_003088 [Melipona bicolor]|uniref:Uncharacterized protein n=1 Tax=Melipona bicolor TaxID=60889 RepID=A0AA40G192_9HYME|nr:hypothetical protein K0M31_003088 [Melipona bicolor]